VGMRRRARKSRVSSGGGYGGSFATRTSAAAKVLDNELCVRSRPGAALPNVGASSLKSPETRHRLWTFVDLRVRYPMARNGLDTTVLTTPPDQPGH
jgi:hypothetical protein